MGRVHVNNVRKVRRRKYDWKEFKPYDWKLTHSYTSTNLFAVVGGRSLGKTYGLRLENIEDYWRNHNRFMEIVRADTDLPEFEKGYFEKIAANREFPDLVYKIEGHCAYIAQRPPQDEEPRWELAGYFVSISKEQKKKGNSYFMVRNFTFDEAVIDRKQNPYNRYMGNEFSTVMGLMNTALRETPDSPNMTARVHFIGNACDLTAPCLRGIGVDTVPKIGRTFYGKKLAMLHRLDNRYSKAFQEKTLVGRLMGLSDYGGEQSGVFFENEFDGEYSDLIMKRTKDATYRYAIVFGRRFGIWYDLSRGYIFISDKAPKGAGKPEFAFTLKDNRIDYIMLDRSSDLIKQLRKQVQKNLIRYENAMVAASFQDVLAFMGVK